MLVVFRSGENRRSFDTFDVIDVVPREKEGIIRKRGLGKKAGKFFWVEVDSDALDDQGFIRLVEEITIPDASVMPVLAITKRAQKAQYKIKQKRLYRLDADALANLDDQFDAQKAKQTLEAKQIYPQRKLTIKQLRRILINKRTGQKLNGN